MRQSEERYVSLLTDFGFKRIFGTDPNKELLINFLNSLFDGEEVIKDVKYLNSENVGDSDKWMYVLKNLSRLDNRPAALREKIFSKLFDAAAVARFTPTELREYEDSLKAYRDIKNSLDTAKEEGREEGLEEGLAKGIKEGLAKGREEGRAEGIALVAKMMYDKGMDIDAIASMIGMSKGEVERLCEQ